MKAICRQQAAGSVPGHHLTLLGNRLKAQQVNLERRGSGAVTHNQAEAVFIPDADSTAIKLRDSTEKWKVKKKYRYLQASLFISSPFGTSAYIIMVRLKCYILFHHRLVLQKTTASKTTSGHSHGEVPHPTPHTGCGDERSRSHRLPACQVPGRGRMDAETPGEEAGPRPRPHVQTSAQGPCGDTAGDPGAQDAWSSLHPGPCLCCA